MLNFYNQKERGPGGFKPRPHKRRRRALESHSKEVFYLSVKNFIYFNFFTCFIITHHRSIPEAAISREILYILLGFFCLVVNHVKDIIPTGDSLLVKITTSEIKHVAQLARLSFDPAEIKNFKRQLNDILEYISKLEELDTSQVASTTHALELTNAFREDEVKPSLSVEKTLSNAPELEGGGYVVPKII